MWKNCIHFTLKTKEYKLKIVLTQQLRLFYVMYTPLMAIKRHIRKKRILQGFLHPCKAYIYTKKALKILQSKFVNDFFSRTKQEKKSVVYEELEKLRILRIRIYLGSDCTTTNTNVLGVYTIFFSIYIIFSCTKYDNIFLPSGPKYQLVKEKKCAYVNRISYTKKKTIYNSSFLSDVRDENYKKVEILN